MKAKVVLLFIIYCLSILMAVKGIALDVMLVVLLLVLLFAVRFVFFRKRMLFTVLLLLSFGLGFARASYLNDAAMFVPAEFENRIVYVTGVVQQVQHGKDYRRYILQAEQIYTKRQSETVYGDINAKIAVTAYDIKSDRALYAYGDRIEVRGIFRLPDTPDNEGEFDFGLWHKTDGVYGSISTKEAYTKYVNKAKMHPVMQAANDVRAYCSATIRKYIGGDAGALLSGILFSDRSDMSAELEKNITIAGLNHICVASGLHISMLYGILMFLFVQLRIRRWVYYPICSLILHMFALVVGGGPSITRAMLMFDLCMLAFFTRGDEDRLYTCVCAGFIMLIVNPLYLFSVGFLLSFSCVFGILLFSRRVDAFLVRYLRFRSISGALAVSLCAQIFTVPILISHFNALSVYSVFYNLAITWSVPFVMVGGILLLALSLFWHLGAQVFAAALRFFMQSICVVVSSASKIPFSTVTVGTPNFAGVVFYYAAIAVAYCLLCAKKVYAQLCIRVMHICMLFITILSVLSSAYLKLSFINVGEGDSALLESPHGVTVLIDGGGSPAFSERNVGEDTVEPYLRHKGIGALDYAIASHYDKDHAQGILYICENMHVKNLILPMRNAAYETEYRTALEQCAKQRGIKVHYMQAGGSMQLPDGLMLEALSPDAEMLKRKLSENNLSLVLRLRYGENDVLFTGDIEKLAEKKMLERDANVQADILKVAHHGSETSSAAAFIENVAPRYALISAGDSDVYGHPHITTVQTIEGCGAEIYNTAEDGDVTFYMQKSGVKWIE